MGHISNDSKGRRPNRQVTESSRRFQIGYRSLDVRNSPFAAAKPVRLCPVFTSIQEIILCAYSQKLAPPIFLENATLNRRKTPPITSHPVDANYHDRSNMVSAKAPCPAPSRSEKALRSLLAFEFSRSRIGLRDRKVVRCIPPGSWCACTLCFVVARLDRWRRPAAAARH